MERTTMGRSTLLTAMILGTLLAATFPGGRAGGQTKDLLPDPPFGGNLVDGTFTTRTGDVKIGDVKVGKVNFAFQMFTTGALLGVKTGGVDAGGAFLYDASGNLALKKGHRLDWVQVVGSTIAGANEWAVPVAANPNPTLFPDTNNMRISPSYTIGRPTKDVGAAPNIYFGDTPIRSISSTVNIDQTWNAELGLVCLDDAEADPDDPKDPNRKAYVLGTISYGFKVGKATYNNETPPDFTKEPTFTLEAPGEWGSASKKYLETLNAAFTGNDLIGKNGKPIPDMGTVKWTFASGGTECFAAVPETPGGAQIALLLLCLTVCVIARQAYRKRRNEVARRRSMAHCAPGSVGKAGILLVIALLACAKVQAQNHGRYLPKEPPPITLATGEEVKNFKFGDSKNKTPQEVTAPIMAGKDNKVGEVRFTYDIWRGDTTFNDKPANAGGAMLGGGFFFDSTTVKVAPGEGLYWIQLVKGPYFPKAIRETWNLKGGEWAPDNTNKLAPLYPFQSLPVPPKFLEEPSRGFQDTPLSLAQGGDATFSFELGLACVDIDNRKVNVLGSLPWGYSITGPNAKDEVPEEYITSVKDLKWGAPSDNFLNTLKDYYDNNKKNDQSTWKFGTDYKDCFVATPEPSAYMYSALLVAFAVYFKVRAVRRRRRTGNSTKA